jgi:3-oxoacyl-[acyl-carrier protein] reductase
MSGPRPTGSPAAEPLAGKIAVVTGGTKGLGLAITRALAAAGAVVVAASRAPYPSTDHGDRITCDRVDVTDSRSVHDLMLRTAATFGGLDIAVANAGINRDARIANMSADDWQATLDTNLTGVFFTIQAAAALMKPLRTGRIITLSSCMASYPAVGAGAYAATKAAIQALTAVAALELGRHGIQCACVAPGILNHGMGSAVASDPRLWERYEPHLAMKRPGCTDEVGHLVAYLAGPHASYINGATIPIDGGIAPWT